MKVIDDCPRYLISCDIKELMFLRWVLCNNIERLEGLISAHTSTLKCKISPETRKVYKGAKRLAESELKKMKKTLADLQNDSISPI